jgi:hypothetical protein
VDDELVKIFDLENAGVADAKIQARIVEQGSTPLGGSPAAFGLLISEATENGRR